MILHAWQEIGRLGAQNHGFQGWGYRDGDPSMHGRNVADGSKPQLEPTCYYRYPSPSLRPGPFWVRPPLFTKVIHTKIRQQLAGNMDKFTKTVEKNSNKAHVGRINQKQKRGFGACGSRLLRFWVLQRWDLRHVATHMQNKVWSGQQQGLERPLFWTATRCWVARLAPLATSRFARNIQSAAALCKNLLNTGFSDPTINNAPRKGLFCAAFACA